MGRLRRHQAEAAEQFDTGGDADQQPLTAQPLTLAGRHHGGQDHGPGMDRTTLEGIVEILPMGGGAVDQRGAETIEAAAMAERRAGTAAIDRRQGGRDIVFTTRGNAQSCHVEKQLACHLDRCCG